MTVLFKKKGGDMKNSIVEINLDEKHMVCGGISKEDMASLMKAVGSVIGFAISIKLLRLFRHDVNRSD